MSLLNFCSKWSIKAIHFKIKRRREPNYLNKGAITAHSEVIQSLEQEMIPVKQAMEERGLRVDVNKLKSLIEQMSVEKERLNLSLRNKLGTGEEVNFNSSKDIAAILSAQLGVELKKSKSGRFITNRKALSEFNNPLTQDLVQYRNLERLLSSLKGFYEATDKKQGKVFCTYTDDCPSGRLYTRDYNLQGISELGRSVVYAGEGCSFILADYDSFELRILSALSHDRYFRECLAQGLDLHKKVVSDMKNIPYDSITRSERKTGKVLNFGLSYGQEAAGLARNLGIPVYEAQKLMNLYKSKIPEIENFKLEAIRKARQTGFTATYFGRKRFIPELLSPNLSESKKSERQVINTKIQGTAADIVKFSLVKLHKEGFLIDTMLHDGILITVRDNELEVSLRRVKEIMESEIEGMKFPVSCKTGEVWSECE